jgi:hypothetical protein
LEIESLREDLKKITLTILEYIEKAYFEEISKIIGLFYNFGWTQLFSNNFTKNCEKRSKQIYG